MPKGGGCLRDTWIYILPTLPFPGRNTVMSASAVEGTFRDCGNSVSINITCTGDECANFSQLANVTCIPLSAGTMSCSNGISCSSFNTSSQFSIVLNNGTALTSTTLNIGSVTYFQNTTTVNGSVAITANGTQPAPVRSGSVRLKARGVRFVMLFTLIVSIVFTPVMAQPQLSEPLNQIWEGISNSQTVISLLNPTLEKVCETYITSPADPAAVVSQAAVTLFCVDTATALLWDTPLFIVVWTVGEFLCARLAEALVESGAKQLCAAISANQEGSQPNNPQPNNPSPVPGLATIPLISETSGPGACMLCWINGYFQNLLPTYNALNSPATDYYVPAKYLVRYFCDSSVDNDEPFPALCASACQDPCQQYDVNAWLQKDGQSVVPTGSNDFCGDLCMSYGSGDCPVPSSQFDMFCSGQCPGADVGCS